VLLYSLWLTPAGKGGGGEAAFAPFCRE